MELSPRLRDLYQEIILLDTDFTVSKEIEQNLWKNVFYKVIEEMRQRIRRYTSQRREDDRQRAQQQLSLFLSVAEDWWLAWIPQLPQEPQNKITRIETKEKLNEKGVTSEGRTSSAAQVKARGWLAVGDLQRYRGEPAALHRAWLSYRRARQSWPAQVQANLFGISCLFPFD